MINSITLKQFFAGLLVIVAAQFMIVNANANPTIFGIAAGKGINLTAGCQTCHTTPDGGKSDLKPNYLAAYQLDKVNLINLKNVINGCAAGQTLNTTTFVCGAGVTKAVVCAIPQIRDPKSNTCVLATTKNSSVGLASSGAGKTDVWTVNCPGASNSLSVAVKDLAPVKLPILSIQATKGTASSILSSDKKDGDALYSPLVKLAKGAGVYTVKVNKSAYTGTAAANKGAELYTALFSCQNAAGSKVVNGPLINTQNQ